MQKHEPALCTAKNTSQHALAPLWPRTVALSWAAAFPADRLYFRWPETEETWEEEIPTSSSGQGYISRSQHQVLFGGIYKIDKM